MARPRIQAEGLSKSFELERVRGIELKEHLLGKILGRRSRSRVFWALRDLSFSVDSGESLGVIGINGAGKSTLLKCLTGILQPDAGRVWLDGKVATLLELGAGFHPLLTGRENILLQASLHGMSRSEALNVMPLIIEFAELGQFIDQPMRSYSSGMYMRLGFSVAVHVDPDILLIDEIISVGDEPFQEKCLERMREFRSADRAIVLVSHDLPTVESFCDRALLLDGGTLVAEGTPASVIGEFHERTAARAPVAEPAY